MKKGNLSRSYALKQVLYRIFHNTLNYFLIIIISSFYVHSQEENMIWHFGINSVVDFRTVPPSIDSGGQKIFEGGASLCDSDGNLLLYTDGLSVFDRTHNKMLNGTNILKPPSGSSTQSSLIVRLPGSDSLYYVFLVNGRTNFAAYGGGATIPVDSMTFSYVVVDLSLNGGLGDVSQPYKVLFIGSSEKITGVKHRNGIDYWILGKQSHTTNMYAFLLTCKGITDTVISAVGVTDSLKTDNGQMKVSPDGKKVATISYSYFNTYGYLKIWDFDDSTGELATLHYDEYVGGYGLEFSGNSKYLYYTYTDIPNSTGRVIFKYDLISEDTWTLYSGSGSGFGSMQLAPNGNTIYIATNSSNLAAIRDVNEIGNISSFGFNALSLAPYASGMSLPNFIVDFHDTAKNSIQPTTIDLSIVNKQACINDDFNLTDKNQSTYNSYEWTIYDALDNIRLTSNSSKLVYNFDTTGTFSITVDIQDRYCQEDSDSLNIEVNNCEVNSFFIPNSFSPNGDGINDIFNVISAYDLSRDDVQLKIFDRFGKLIYSSNTLSWDGGQNSPASYTYVLISGINNKKVIKSGTITLLW